MEEQVARLVEKAWEKFQALKPDQRLLMGISGIPGSGKTTLSQIVTNRLNNRAAALDPSDPSPVAAFVPMDGYHLTRAQLSAMPDPVNAHARRGAAFTFDAPAFHRLVVSLRQPLTAASSSPVYAPSFDHAVKDPKENDIAVLPSHRIVVFEGNYLALDKPPWSDAARLMDELWFVDVDFEVARKRLIGRHVKAGIAKNEEEADKRARDNDLVNGREIIDFRLEVDEVVISREDDDWVHE